MAADTLMSTSLFLGAGGEQLENQRDGGGGSVWA